MRRDKTPESVCLSVALMLSREGRRSDDGRGRGDGGDRDPSQRVN